MWYRPSRGLTRQCSQATSGSVRQISDEGATMTNFTKNLTLAAAALVVAAGAASAQTIALKVDIPFAFQVAGKAMPAGAYRVTNVSSNSTAVFALQTPGSSVVVLPEGRR